MERAPPPKDIVAPSGAGGWRVEEHGRSGALILTGLGTSVHEDTVRTAVHQFAPPLRIALAEHAAGGWRKGVAAVDLGGLKPAKALADQFTTSMFMVGGMPRPVSASYVDTTDGGQAEGTADTKEGAACEPRGDAEVEWARQMAELVRQQALERRVLEEEQFLTECDQHLQQASEMEDQLKNCNAIENLVKGNPLAQLARLHNAQVPKRWALVEDELRQRNWKGRAT